MNDLCNQLGYTYLSIQDYTSTGEISNGYDSLSIRLLQLANDKFNSVELDLYSYIQKKIVWF